MAALPGAMTVRAEERVADVIDVGENRFPAASNREMRKRRLY